MTKEEIKRKVEEAVQKAKEAASGAWNWCVENKENIAAMVPTALGIIGVYKALKPTMGERERDRKDTEYYDPHSGMRWRLRRKPTNSEWAELSRRQRCGECTEDILYDMGILK